MVETHPASNSVIVAVHFSHEFEPESFIDFDIGFALRTLKIAAHALTISLISDDFHQLASDSLPMVPWQNSDSVTEVVAARVGPHFAMRFFLLSFPDPVPSDDETPVAPEADVGKKLADFQDPVLVIGSP